jgi:hypothetical protein
MKNAVETARKILSRAIGDSPEAIAARLIARDFMTRHRLSTADVSVENVTIPCGPHDPSRERVAAAIAAKYGCEVVVGDLGIAFRGREDKAGAAARLYAAITNAAKARQEIPSTYAINLPASAAEAWRLIYWIGFADAVVNKLHPPAVAPIGVPNAPVDPAAQARDEEAARRALEALELTAIDMASWLAPVTIDYMIQWMKKKANIEGARTVVFIADWNPPKRPKGLLRP